MPAREEEGRSGGVQAASASSLESGQSRPRAGAKPRRVRGKAIDRFKDGKRLPGLLCHKRSGRAFVVLNGKQHHVGTYGTPEARAEYFAWSRSGKRVDGN